MENCLSQPMSKINKCMEGQGGINKLHDDLLLHILSSLPMKNAVRTSVLAKRWRYLWACLPNIDLDTGPLGNNRGNLAMKLRFKNLIARSLIRRGSISLKKLRIALDFFENPRDIEAWVSIAIERGVEVLDLSFCQKQFFMLPVIWSNQLTSLNLKMGGELEVDSDIEFPFLKTFYLTDAKFRDEETVLNLLSCCWILEELVIDNCVWNKVKNVALLFPKLLKCTFWCDSPMHSEDMLDCQIKIFADKLEFLDCQTCLTIDLLFCDAPSSVKPSFSLRCLMSGEENEIKEERKSYRAIKSIHFFADIKELTLSLDTLVSFFHLGTEMPFPMFNNMLKLTVSSQEPFYLDDAINIELLYFLHRTPNLKFLEINEPICPEACDIFDHPPPVCVSSSLQSFGMSCFRDSKEEMHFLTCLVKYAALLETLSITGSSDEQDVEKREKEVKDDLQAHRTGLKSCEIQVSLVKA